MDDYKQAFKDLVGRHISRPGIDNLMAWLENTDFYTAPASTRYHGNYVGGLVEHSLTVFRQLEKLAECYGYSCNNPSTNTAEQLAIVALFHDLCKVDYYKPELRWRKDKHQRWEQYETYKVEEGFCYGGHGAKSVFLVQSFITLNPDEAAAINCHMGQWDSTAYSKPSDCYGKNALAWLLHVADEAATYVDGI